MLQQKNAKKTITLFILLCVCVVVLFGIKYNVRQKSKRLNHIEDSIRQALESIHILKAELAYLTRPEYIKNLSDKYLDLEQISKKHLISIEDIGDISSIYDNSQHK